MKTLTAAQHSKRAALQVIALEAQRLQGSNTREARAAMDALVKAASPILRRVAFRYAPKSGALSADDLFQVAAIAMLSMLNRFTPEGPEHFGGWLTITLRWRLSGYVRLHGREVRVPQNAHLAQKPGCTRLSFISRDALLAENPGMEPSWESTGDAANAELALVANEQAVLVRRAVYRLPRQQREAICSAYGINRVQIHVRGMALAYRAPFMRVRRYLDFVREELRAVIGE